MKPQVVYGASRFTDHDAYLFKEGTHARLYEKLGAHVYEHGGKSGTHFAVWAPNAREVSVLGEFNGWDPSAHYLSARQDGSGIWEGFVPGIGHGSLYKFHINSQEHGYRVEKGDPFSLLWEIPPKTASVVWDLGYNWGDGAWMAGRAAKNALDAPMSVYECHIGSWKRVPDEGYRSLSYRELADELPRYLQEMNFTHVEFLPVMEHPFFGSWGYQTLGFFAPSSRFGTPQEFMFLVDKLHQAGIGVILDWVPSHFPSDDYGLGYFDGTHLYEHSDPRQGYHPDWKSYIFNYGRHEVRSYLMSSAMFWLDKYHVDGLRVDAVASMLYLDYSRKDGEWIANQYGGKENIPAIEFLRKFNEEAYGSFPGIQTIAEESTAWPMVSRPAYVGGLGFGLKWNMGWMHDTLAYFSQDPVHRKYHHNQLTFNIMYAFTENFMLPLSHDEVVHGKGSLFGKMPGDDWRKFANLRLLYGYMYGQPGKKLLFMGDELAQIAEWNHDSSLEWHLLEHAPHLGVKRWVEDLNRFYRDTPPMHQVDFHHTGFQWVDLHDADQSVLAFLRKAKDPSDMVLGVFNFTPVVRDNYRLGVPRTGLWREVLNSDAGIYGGSGQGNLGGVQSVPIPSHGHYDSISLVLPPMSAVYFAPAAREVGSGPGGEMPV